MSEADEAQDQMPIKGSPVRDDLGRFVAGHPWMGGGGGPGRPSAAQERADYNALVAMFDGEYTLDEIEALLDKTKRKSVRKVMLAMMHGGNDKLIASLFNKLYPDRQKIEAVVDLPPMRIEIVTVTGAAQDAPPTDGGAMGGVPANPGGEGAPALAPAIVVDSAVTGDPVRKVRPLDPPFESDLGGE
jgi:hypothetical protein